MKVFKFGGASVNSADRISKLGDILKKYSGEKILVVISAMGKTTNALEKVTLASDICGWLEGRSRFSRLGLLVHISASFMQPGIENKQVLEISNQSPMPLAL